MGATLEAYSRKGTEQYETISRIVNGPEAFLPVGWALVTSDQRTREEFRVKWWMDLRDATCREAIFPEDPEIPDELPRNLPVTNYPEGQQPTFFGHYAIKAATPAPIQASLACLDYGMGKGGFLCAYRWDRESQINAGKFFTAQG